MLSRDYLDLFLKKAYFTNLEHLLFRTIVNGGYPNDMYFSSRVKETLTRLVNEIRKREAKKKHGNVTELYEIINDVIEKELGGE